MHCCIHSYVLQFAQHLHQNDSLSKTIREFMVLMSVCHTVIPEKLPDSEDIIYHASSPGNKFVGNFAFKVVI